MMETSRDNNETRLKKTPLLWVVLILLVAAVIRLYGLNNFSPPGLEHDEVANWLIDRAILDGQHGIYFSEAYGHEAGFHYLQAASVALLGDHALALRLPAALLGLLVVAVQYTLHGACLAFRWPSSPWPFWPSYSGRFFTAVWD